MKTEATHYIRCFESVGGGFYNGFRGCNAGDAMIVLSGV